MKSLEEEFEIVIESVYKTGAHSKYFVFNINKPNEWIIDVQYLHLLVNYFNICSWDITLCV